MTHTAVVLFQTNLVQRSSVSQAELSSREMTRSVPALLAKVTRLRPRVICFNGKGIWLHVERSLRPQADHGDDDRDGAGLVPVPRTAESSVTVKEEEMDDLAPGASVDPVPGARPPKAEPALEPTAFNTTTDSACPGTDGDGDGVSRRYLLAVQSAERTSDSSALSPSMRARCSGATSTSRASSKRATAGARSAFAYGLQPYKIVHDVMGNVRVPLLLRARIIEIFV